MNVTMLLDMAADGFGDRVVVGTREEGLTAARLRDVAAGAAALIAESGADSVLYLPRTPTGKLVRRAVVGKLGPTTG